MGHCFQNRHFPQKTTSSLSVTKDVFIPFAGVFTLGLKVQDLHHSAISTLTELFDELEIFRQFEVRIKVVEAKTEFVLS